MNKKDNKEKNIASEPDISSDATCPICEGQGCECSSKEENNNDSNDEVDESEMNSNNISQLSRLIAVKEQHAKEVKSEVATIWGDYFKEPQITKYPEIHELVHSIMQLASKCKQNTKREDGVELLKKINKFTEIFWNTKGVKTEKKYAPYPPELVIVCPVLKSV